MAGRLELNLLSNYGIFEASYRIKKSNKSRYIMKLITYLSFIFFFSELLLLIVKRSGNYSAKARQDNGSLIIIWIMIFIGFFGGFYLAKHTEWNSVNYLIAGAGLLLVLIGFIIRWTAILQLGKSFTVDVTIVDVANLKTDGLYKSVRHPSYSGLLLIIMGFSVTMNSIYSYIALSVPVFLAVSYRISVEEKVLINEFGENYNKYKAKTKKIIPGIY
jgi:protein-S-isoprenylcysteine O-methyltransferase Ste14